VPRKELNFVQNLVKNPEEKTTWWGVLIKLTRSIWLAHETALTSQEEPLTKHHVL
jgi:hypothetical protein